MSKLYTWNHYREITEGDVNLLEERVPNLNSWPMCIYNFFLPRINQCPQSVLITLPWVFAYPSNKWRNAHRIRTECWTGYFWIIMGFTLNVSHYRVSLMITIICIGTMCHMHRVTVWLQKKRCLCMKPSGLSGNRTYTYNPQSTNIHQLNPCGFRGICPLQRKASFKF